MLCLDFKGRQGSLGQDIGGAAKKTLKRRQGPTELWSQNTAKSKEA